MGMTEGKEQEVMQTHLSPKRKNSLLRHSTHPGSSGVSQSKLQGQVGVEG